MTNHKSFFNFSLAMAIMGLLMLACKKEYQGDSDLNQIKYNHNRNSYPKQKLDSTEALGQITQQKIQELFDLSALYAGSKRDTEIDSVIYAQIQSYFLDADSAKINRFIHGLDSLKVRYSKIAELNLQKIPREKDTIHLANYKIDLFNSKKAFIGQYPKQAHFIVQRNSKKSQAFKIYFIDLAPKDSIPSGQIK
jgi:hypothetical protein